MQGFKYATGEKLKIYKFLEKLTTAAVRVKSADRVATAPHHCKRRFAARRSAAPDILHQ